MEVKGTAVTTIPAFVKAKHGDAGYRKWLDSLQPATREAFSGTMLSSAWYPLREMLIEPTVSICGLFYGGAMLGAVELGRFSAEQGLKGVYRLFVRIGSPEYIISKAGQILPTYYRPSAMTVPEHSHGRALVRITEFAEPHPVVEHRMAGWMEQALTICGVKRVQSKIVVSMTMGSPHTDFQLTWS
jgi:hypothetical protein